MLRLIFLLILVFILPSCGGGGSDSNSVEIITGQFIDDPVQGLNYDCSSGATGVTNSQGEYSCNAGDTVTFSVGSVIIGNVLVQQAIITPYSLFPDNVDAAINLARLLQSIDSDGDPNNGVIDINAALASLLPVGTDFESPTFVDDVQISLGITLTSYVDALSHLNEVIIDSGGVIPLGAHIPVADAGADQSVSLAANVTLDGSASSDADGDTLSYSWSIISRPAGSNVELITPNHVTTTFTSDVAGTYVFELVVSDGVLIHSDRVSITANVVVASSNANLSALVLSDGTLSPVFTASTTSYSASVDNGISSINVTPTVEDAGATITITGFTITSGAPRAIPLAVGANTLTFTVTAADGSTTKSYTVTVIRAAPSSNANLSALTLLDGTLSPVFNASTTSYTATVGNAVETVTMTPTTADTGATISLSGFTLSSGSPYTPIGSLAVGVNQFNLVVTAADGASTKTYTLTVTREAASSNADLSGLVLAESAISPVFDAATTSYTATVGNAVETVTITLTTADSGATISHAGFNITSGSSFTLPVLGSLLQVGDNIFQLVVTAADSTTTKIYTLTVTRQAAASTNGWSHPLDELSYINPDGVSGAMVTAMNNNGQAIAAWTAYDDSTDCGESGGNPCFQVFISQYQNGSWTTPPDLSSNISPDGFNATNVQVAISDNGDAVVVWKMNTAWASLCSNVTFQCSRIFMSEYRNGTWTHPADMNDYIDPANTNNVSLTPTVAMDSIGNTIIAWRNYGGGVYKSEYRNGAWVHPLNINDDIPLSMWNPTVAMDDNGNALIVWQGIDSVYDNRIYLSEYRNGSWSHPANLDTDALNPAGQSCPGITCSIPVKIAMDNDDNAIIAWDQRTTAYSDYADGSIYKSEYRNGSWTHPADIDDKVSLGSDTDWARYPEVAMDDNGNAMIIWSQNDETLDCEVTPPGFYSSNPGPCKQMFMSEYRDGSWTVPLSMSDHISPTGQPVTTISGFQTYSVAMGNTGEAVIAWSQSIPSETCGETPDRQIFVSEYRDGGWSHPAGLNDYLIDLNIFSYLPLATMDNSGNILLGWRNSVSDLFFSEYHCADCVTALPEVIAPRNLQATASDGQVDLSWHMVSNADYYNIFWSSTGVASTSDNKITAIAGTPYQHTGLTNKTNYSYLVTAVVSATESLPSNWAAARPSACVGCAPVLAQTFLSGSTSQDEGNGIVVDSTGNVFVTGHTWGDMDENTSNGSSDIFISKYSGGSRQWTVQPGTSGYEKGNALALDTNGNIYVAGAGYLLSKYNSAGALQWSVPATYPDVEAKGIALDPSGNIYITGATQIDLDGNTNHGGGDIFISKYNAAGTRQWTVQPGTALDDAGNAIAVDSMGNVYVSGYTLVNGNYIGRSFITRYSTDGDLLWYDEFERGGDQYMDKAYGIALDADNNAYITGHTNHLIYRLNYSLSGFEVYVAKYNTDGCLQWTAQRGVSGSFDYSYGITVDKDANVFVTGSTQGALDGNSYAGEQDIFIMKFDTKGIHGWTKQYGEAGIDFSNAIAVSADGTIYTTGASDGSLNGELSIGNGNLYNYDAFMMIHSSQE